MGEALGFLGPLGLRKMLAGRGSDVIQFVDPWQLRDTPANVVTTNRANSGFSTDMDVAMRDFVLRPSEGLDEAVPIDVMLEGDRFAGDLNHRLTMAARMGAPGFPAYVNPVDRHSADMAYFRGTGFRPMRLPDEAVQRVDAARLAEVQRGLDPNLPDMRYLPPSDVGYRIASKDEMIGFFNDLVNDGQMDPRRRDAIVPLLEQYYATAPASKFNSPVSPTLIEDQARRFYAPPPAVQQAFAGPEGQALLANFNADPATVRRMLDRFREGQNAPIVRTFVSNWQGNPTDAQGKAAFSSLMDWLQALNDYDPLVSGAP